MHVAMVTLLRNTLVVGSGEDRSWVRERERERNKMEATEGDRNRQKDRKRETHKGVKEVMGEKGGGVKGKIVRQDSQNNKK